MLDNDKLIGGIFEVPIFSRTVPMALATMAAANTSATVICISKINFNL